jgi:hypothetical protein
MPANPQGQPMKEARLFDPRQREAIISGHVLHALGQPSNLHRVQVHALWNACYRVNVFVGPDATSSRLAHSFFVVTDEGGTVVATTPRIDRLY